MLLAFLKRVVHVLMQKNIISIDTNNSEVYSYTSKPWNISSNIEHIVYMIF